MSPGVASQACFGIILRNFFFPSRLNRQVGRPDWSPTQKHLTKSEFALLFRSKDYDFIGDEITGIRGLRLQD